MSKRYLLGFFLPILLLLPLVGCGAPNNEAAGESEPSAWSLDANEVE